MDPWAIQLTIQVVLTVAAVWLSHLRTVAQVDKRLTAVETRIQVDLERSADLQALVKLEVLQQLAQHQRDCPAAQDQWISPSGVRRNPLGESR
jgi:hypothetical protein